MDDKPNPSKWSKKEILGHLCDSASVNHKRFVEILISKEPITIHSYSYNQDLWMQVHNYQHTFSTEELLHLWISLNKRIIKLLTNVTEKQLQLPCKTEDQNIVTLEWLVTDYIDHMNHHFKQIFDE
ncbi:DinB family protein [Bacillus sp. CGMCC 1.60114]|uniref:DinB family protein n=1 Tax=unclassified Bacillus (in: firmicutes) TaxID=185979 RepID=UPI00362D8284